MHFTLTRLWAAVTVVSLAVSASAFTYTEDFETDNGGWAGDGDYHSATGGVSNSGYKGGQRTTFFAYLAPENPPASNALLGDVKTRFGGLIRFSYYLKVITGGPPVSPQLLVFAGSNIWAVPLASGTYSDWTKVQIEFDPNWSDADAKAAGWYNGPWQGGSFAAVWSGVTYYNFFSATGSGATDTGIDSVRAETIPAFTPPPNDNCSSAQAVSDGQVSGIQWTATSDGNATCGSSTGSPDVWYAYTATCSDHLRIKLVSGNYSPVVSVHSACPGTTGNQLGCLKLTGPADLLTVPVASGNTYYIRVSGSTGEKGIFTLDLSCGQVPGTLPYCDHFTSLADLDVNASGLQISADVGPAPGGKSGNALHLYNSVSGAYVNLNPNVVSIPDAVTVRFQFYVVSDTDFIGVYQYPPSEGLRIFPDGNLSESYGHTSLGAWQPNTWYTVAMVQPGNGTQDVFIKAGANASVTGLDYKGTIGPGGHPMTHSTFFDYAGDYYLADYCIEVGNTVPPAPPPANDVCGSGTAIGNGTFTANLLGATSDGDASCGNSGGGADVWYTWTATCSDHLTILPTAGTITPVISVHSICPGTTSNELACTSGLFNPLILAVTSGQQYRIRVASSGGAIGTATFTVSCGPPPPPPSNNVYCHDFTDLHDLTTDGFPQIESVSAPGGKTGKALHVTGASGSYVILTPSVSIPALSTVVFRYYIHSHTNFQGVYNYAPGEGLVVRDGGTFGWSCNGNYGVPWQTDTWYTIAIERPVSGSQKIYAKQGANAVLTAADLLGPTCGGVGTMTRTIFFDYGGEVYVADYTINRNLDFTVCTDNVCHTPFADADGDGDVDMNDFGRLQRCYTGAGQGPVPSGQGYEYCHCFDRPQPGFGNGDNDVDADDLAKFILCAKGSGVPASPACGN